MRTDDEFRTLVGCVTTLYAVRKRKVEGLSARSFKAAKETLVHFAATTAGWAVQGPAGDRRWRRGPLHEAEAVQGRPRDGDVVGLGRRSGGLRSRICPACGQDTPVTFRKGDGVRCPKCAGKSLTVGSQHGSPEGPQVGAAALELICED